MDIRVEEVRDSQLMLGAENKQLQRDSLSQTEQMKPKFYAATTGLLLSVPLFMFPKPKYISVSMFRQPINIVRPIKAACVFAAGITFILACTSVQRTDSMETKSIKK